MKYCNEFTVNSITEADIQEASNNLAKIDNSNTKDNTQDDNNIEEDNTKNENNIENNSNKTMEDRINEIKESRNIDSNVSPPLGNYLSEEDGLYYNTIFMKEKDLEDKKEGKSDNINTLEKINTDEILDNEETPKPSPNKFFSFFQIENKWKSNKDSKFIAGKDISEQQANLNKEIEDLNSPWND